MKNVVVRAGFGMFYDRGEYFTELSASAGLGISGPFSVTTQEPFTIPLNTSCAELAELSFQCAIWDDASSPADQPGGFGNERLVPDMRHMAACNQATAPGMQQPNMPYCNVNRI